MHLNKKYINRYIELNVKHQPDIVKGLLSDYSKEWSLLYNNPVDYVIDGYLLVKNDQITNCQLHRSTSLKSIILRKKQAIMSKPNTMNIENSETLFQNLFKEKIVFSISNSQKNTFLIGRIKNVSNTKFDFELITPKVK